MRRADAPGSSVLPLTSAIIACGALHPSYTPEKVAETGGQAGAAAAPMRDAHAVRGDWPHGPNKGGVPLLALALVALPMGLMALSRLRRASAGLI